MFRSFTDIEEGAFAMADFLVSCIHLDNGSRENPDEKSWKNKHRKEILFTPDSLILRNNKGMSIEIDDSGRNCYAFKKVLLVTYGRHYQLDRMYKFYSGYAQNRNGNESRRYRNRQ